MVQSSFSHHLFKLWVLVLESLIKPLQHFDFFPLLLSCKISLHEFLFPVFRVPSLLLIQLLWLDR